MRARRCFVSLLGLSTVAAACESAPLAERTSAGPGGGTKIEVELLDAHFVRVDGVRQPWEELVYDLRTTCRAAQYAALRGGAEFVPPWIRFRVAEDADAVRIPDGTFDRITTRLREAGVRRIEIDT